MEKCVMLLVFVLSVCEAAAQPSCTEMQYRLKRRNEETNRLLERMGDRMPQECLEETYNSFPKDVFIKTKNEDFTLVALWTLRGVDAVFKNNKTSVTWDRRKLALFRNVVNTQVETLQKCVGKEVQAVTDTPADSSTATLTSYFKQLEERLRERGFSACGWEMVRTELQDGLKEFQTFLQKRL